MTPTPVTPTPKLNWLQIVQLVVALGPGVLALLEGILAAINSTPGTPEHAAALARAAAAIDEV